MSERNTNFCLQAIALLCIVAGGTIYSQAINPVSSNDFLIFLFVCGTAAILGALYTGFIVESIFIDSTKGLNIHKEVFKTDLMRLRMFLFALAVNMLSLGGCFLSLIDKSSQDSGFMLSLFVAVLNIPLGSYSAKQITKLVTSYYMIGTR